MDAYEVMEDEDDFAEFYSSVCSKTCLAVLEVFCTVSTVLNVVVFLAFFKRKKPLSSREVFMFVLIVNDVLRTTVGAYRNWWPVWVFPYTDNVWLCRIHFLLSETCAMCSLLFPAFYAIYECCTRGFPTSPLAAFLSQHRSSLLVDLSILMIGLCSPVIFVVGETHFSHYSCVFMYYNTEETGFATAYAISYRVRLALKTFSLISMWMATVVLLVKVSEITPTSRTRLRHLWAEQKLLISLLMKLTFLASPYGVFIPLLWQSSVPTLLVGEIAGLALMLDTMTNAPLFLWITEELRFWTAWTLPEFLKTCRQRKSCQELEGEQDSV
ncbi:uncharacterized protein LOC114828311 [Galendromus occidentalis]|uniref:Uncharacterized protein LOC114828311 n=1 Tax=Galendromus occidentalis TaxID=34638 RepID=A0AAJ7SFH4_9ACAR|nr:uncharacterized protein LOC114828311 [Galendromus occidentalis]